MAKYPHFIGQPIFSQLISLISRNEIYSISRELQSDYYCKKFDTYHHLITMLYGVFHKCTSIREITTGMQACHKKLQHLGMSYCPRRSTISDANVRRTPRVFENIYFSIYDKYKKSLPDSRSGSEWMSKLYIADSTTISLFKEILKNAGRTPNNGKRKGGLKVHTLIKADENVPCLVKMSAAASHDVFFIQKLALPKGSFIVFDKGYVDYTQYDLWSQQQVNWVTRLRQGAVYEAVSTEKLSEDQIKKGILLEQQIILGHTTNEKVVRTMARLIHFYDHKKQKVFAFITNNNDLEAYSICQIYKQRWQIELLFKRIKQAYPLQYFLGDNENAIKIQVWCALIADLLIQIVQAQLVKKWSYSNLMSMIRIHLMTYIDLLKFLENPDKSLLQSLQIQNKGPTLFD